MVMKTLRQGAFAGAIKYVIFGFIGVSMVGMVLMDVGTSFRNNLANDRDVAVVEGRTISLQDFDRSARYFLSASGISPQKAYEMGFLNEILAQEIKSYMAMIESENLGVSFSNDQIKNSIAKAVQPLLQDGQDLQSAFEMVLQERQMSERDFIKGIRRELHAALLTKTISDSFYSGSEELMSDMMQFQAHTRDVDVLVFDDKDMKDVKAPTEEQMKDLYESFKETRFLIPEYRVLKLGIYKPSEETDKVIDITDEEAEEYYSSHSDEFAVSDQKIITQALLNDEAKATQIAALAHEGAKLEDAFKKVMGEKAQGLTPDIRLETSSMFPEMKTALENVDLGKVVGPLRTQLGFHVIRLDGTLPAMTRPFSEVKASIKQILGDEKKASKLNDITTAFEDHFMQGGKIADSSNIAALSIIDLPAVNNSALNKEGKDAFTGLDANISAVKADIIKNGFEILPDDAERARILPTPDGNFIVVEMVSVEEKSYKPFETVKQDIIDQYTADQQAAMNSERVAKLIGELREGKMTFDDLIKSEGKTPVKIKDLRVMGSIQPPLNEEIRISIFKEPIGSFIEFQPEHAAAIVYVRDFKMPELSAEQMKGLAQLSKSMESETKQDAEILYLHAIGKRYEARINDDLLKRAYGLSSNESGIQ